jgi:hypothetical protein
MKSEKNELNFGYFDVFSKLVPVVGTAVGSFLWAYFSPRNILVNYPDLFLVSVGYLIAFLVGRIVLARVCGQDPLNWFQPILIPLLFGVVNAVMKE